MKDRYIISITNINGARHYDIHKFLTKGVILFIVFLFFSLPLTVFTIHCLNQRLNREKTLNADIVNAVTGNYAETARMGERLDKDLFAGIEDIYSKIEYFEDNMAINTSPGLNLAERIEQVRLQSMVREEEYREIGDKILDIERIVGIESTDQTTRMQRVETAQEQAMIKRSMLDQIPNGYPVPFRGITSPFGKRNHPINNNSEFHKGTDLSAKMKTTITATADGIVEYAGLHSDSGLGRLVILRHNYGFRTAYGHLSIINVKTGDFIRKGQSIALSGNTGVSNGPHLHYEIRFIDRCIDPEPFLRWHLENFDDIFQKEKRVKWQSLQNWVRQHLNLSKPPSLQVAQR